MPKSNTEKQTTSRLRKQRAWRLVEKLSMSHGYAVTHRDKSGVDEFIDAVETGEVVTILLNDDDYSFAISDLERLAKYFGNSAEFWLGLQQDFDLETTRERISDELEQINTI